jgi:hypothetical protein
MSFEGYYQKLCKNGHYATVDVYNDYLEWKCAVCGEKEAWSNIVDYTNGTYEHDPDTDEYVCDAKGKKIRIDGYIDLEISRPALRCTCKDCGNTHSVSATIYKIPKDR